MAYQHYWVGLDAGHLETAVCLIDAEGGILFEAICETKSGPIRDILRRFGVEAAQCLTIEAGNGTQMVRELRSYGFPVQVVDVRKSSKFLAIRRQKTDVHDARGLAELGRLARSMGSQVFVKPMEHQNIRTLINVRRTMLKNRARTDALIQSIFRLYGGNVKLLNGRGALAAEVNNQVRKMRQHGLEIGVNLQPLVEISEALREQISALGRQMRDIASNNPTCRNFQTIPGVGAVIALSFYSAIGDPHRFERSRDVGAYYPTVWQMTSSIRGRIRQGETPVSIIRALFPCGSITGAPKIMASRIIASLERWDRGPYTGSIGWLARDAASMNVAIRTIHRARGSSLSRLDVGAGIVAESDPSQEWAECLAKARFAGRVRERPARIHPVSTSA